MLIHLVDCHTYTYEILSWFLWVVIVEYNSSEVVNYTVPFLYVELKLKLWKEVAFLERIVLFYFKYSKSVFYIVSLSQLIHIFS